MKNLAQWAVLERLKQVLWGAVAAGCMLLSACGGGGSAIASDPMQGPEPDSGLTSTIVPNADATTALAVSQSYTIGGTLTGLASGASVTLLNNNRDPITLSADGAFAFPLPVSGSYNVTVRAQPRGQVCTVGNGMGGTLVANVDTVRVTCSSQTYTLGGTVSGMNAGGVLVLRNNGADALTLRADGAFVFRVPLASNSSYAVTVARQPVGQTCTVMNYAGEGVATNISNVDVQCSAKTFKLPVLVRGLASWARVTLLNNGADPLLVTANGSYTFPTGVVYNGSFNVTVGTQPDGQVCTVARGTGVGVVTNIPTVVVTCSTVSFSVGGTVSGLTGQLILRNNSGPGLFITANGSFTFPARVAYNGSYLVTVYRQPQGQTCTVINGSGAGITGDINTISVVCAARALAVGGTLSGLAAGGQVTLVNNGSDPLKLTANGSFVFAAPVAYGGSYAVTVASQPAGQTCTVTAGTGSGITVAVTRVVVRCAANSSTFTVGGSVSGLATGTQLTLLNNGDDPLTVTANGTFTFATPVAINSSYAVTVGTQAQGQTCSVSNGSGAGVTANVSTVAVMCSANTFTIGGVLGGLAAGAQLTLLNNGADPLTLGANGGFRFATPVAFGGSYAVTVGTSPAGQSCSVSNGSGSTVAANISNVAVSCAALPVARTQYAYVANFQGNNLSQFAIGTDGSLSPLSVPTVATGIKPYQVVSANGAVYALNQGEPGSMGSVSQFRITANGVLAPMTPATVSTRGANASDMVISPNGLYAYVGNQQGQTIAQYNVAATGELSSMATPTVAAGGPLALSIDPAGKFLYATGAPISSGSTTKGVEVYAIGSNGALSRVGVSGVLSNFFSYGLSMDPGGQHLYATNWLENTVAQFSINSTSGLLTALSPATVAATTNPVGIAVHPNGSYVYVPGSQDSQIAQYAVGAGGALTSLGSLTVSPARDGLRGIRFDRTGQFVYMSNGTTPTGYVLQFRVGADGRLTKITADVAAGNAAYAVTTAYYVAAP